MRAVAAFPATREVRVIDLPEPPKVTGSQVLLKVLEVGICGTDREIGAFKYGTPPPGTDHLVLGHEALAEVADIGPEVTLFRKGELVVPTVRRPCTHHRCRPCRIGRPDFCITGDFRERGIKELDGFLQQWTVEDEMHLVAVHRKLADVAVLTEPLTVSAKAGEQALGTLHRLPWEHGQLRTMALGAGPVGLLGAMSMVVHHFETLVWSLEPADSDRAHLVRSFGATYISAQDVPLRELRRKIGQIDAIYEAIGISSVALTALEALGPNGLLALTGVPPLGQAIELNTDALMRGLVLSNQLILGTVNASRGAFELALRDLEQAMFLFPHAVRGLITRRVPIEEAPALITHRGGIKQVVRLAASS